MTDHSEHAVLNRLIVSCRDGERGFTLAASKVKSAQLRQLFRDLAAQRAQFVSELLPHAQRMGGDGPSEGSVLGTLHRGWLTFEDAVHHDDAKIVRDAEAGDRSTLHAYAEAIAVVMPPETRDLIERQFRELEAAHARIPVTPGAFAPASAP